MWNIYYGGVLQWKQAHKEHQATVSYTYIYNDRKKNWDP